MRIVVFDTESTGLTAIMGRILCASYKWHGNPEVKTFRIDDRRSSNPLRKEGELSVLRSIRAVLESANLVVSQNGKLHDIPLLNARLAKYGERPIRLQWHLDTRWFFNGGQMKIGSAKLENVAKYFRFKNQKTPLDWDVWQLAAAGDRKAMDEVVEHCVSDVLALEEAYEIVLPYVSNLHR